MTAAIGIDVGGSGIKAAAVDVATGALIGERVRIRTPQPATPAAVIDVIARLVHRIDHATAAHLGVAPERRIPALPPVSRPAPVTNPVPVGVTIPAVVLHGVVKTAANIDPSWIDVAIDDRLRRVLDRDVVAVNDADAAGIAEMRFGAGVGRRGTVVALTLGTGVGSAVFADGHLVPNTELGHMEIRGRDAERRSAADARTRRGLSWKAWAADLDEHLAAIHRILWPELFIIGGGVSKRAEQFLPLLTVPCEVVPAALRNDAGIVGAAMAVVNRGPEEVAVESAD